MRTHIAKTGYLSAEYIPPTFWLEAPSPYSAGWRWGLLSRKIFFIFQSRLTRFKFLDISQGFRFFWFIQYKLSFRLDTSFARYLLVCDSRIRFWIYTRINFDLFQHCRFYALTLQLFISLTLLLVINKHLCLYELFYAYFGFLKAFWRVFVCFRCSLSSWVKIMRQKA